MKFSLHAGLVLRHGQRTLEIVRQLGDDDYQIEDCLTRRPSTIDRLTLLKRIWSKTYEIVLPAGSEAAAAKMPPEGVRIDIGSLKKEVRVGIDRRKQYVDALQKGHVTRGQRARVAVIIAKVA